MSGMIRHYVKCGIDTLDSARELLTSRPAPVLGPHGNFRSKWGGGSPSTAPSLTELPALLDAPAAAPENHLACSGHCVCRGVVLSGGETGNCTTAPARTCTQVRGDRGAGMEGFWALPLCSSPAPPPRLSLNPGAWYWDTETGPRSSQPSTVYCSNGQPSPSRCWAGTGQRWGRARSPGSWPQQGPER